MSVNRRVFWPAAIISLLFVLLAVLFTEPMAQRVAGLQDFIVTRFGWFYILSVTGFLIFALYLFVSPYGSIRLGADDDEPEYSYPSWFAMLFSAGMGIGILFYGVAEPVLHYAKPPASLGPGMQPETIESAKEAIHLAYFHWGLHAWAVYIIVGLALAYFAYRHDLPLTIRSTLWPLLGERIHGPAGDIVDILAIFGTLFGLATSLGLGVLQVNAGLDYLGLMSTGLTNQIWLIVGITLAATLSVVSGLDNGIKRLSEINLGVGLVLLLFVFALGPTVFLVSTLVENIGYYLQTLVGTSFRTTAFRGTEWQKSWTMFYWGWWISWAPFVGMFIARISRGRTIREFVGGVLFAPTLLTFVWFGVFGNTALHREIFGAGGMVEAVDADVATAIYVLLDQLPWPTISSALAALLVTTFFITSADSGALVMDIISSNGNPQPGLPGRIFWALSSGAIAIVLLMVGGLTALQTAAITTALPFACIMILMCWSVYRGLHAERRRRRRLPEMETAGQGAAAPGRTGDWRSRLGSILGRRDQRQSAPPDPRFDTARGVVAGFIETVVLPAFSDLAVELRQHGREALIDHQRYYAVLIVRYRGEEEFRYAIRGRVYHALSFSMAQLTRPRQSDRPTAEILPRGGIARPFAIASLDRQALIDDFLAEYAKWKGW